MTYSQLLSDLAALRLHPLADTNGYAVTSDMGAVVLQLNGTDELEELREKVEALENECADLECTIEDLKNQIA